MLTDQEAKDVLIIAFEDGGVAYWASDFTPCGCEDGWKFSGHGRRLHVDRNQVKAAALKVIVDRLAADDILADIARRDIDVTSADVIVQVATLGEVIYS